MSRLQRAQEQLLMAQERQRAAGEAINRAGARLRDCESHIDRAKNMIDRADQDLKKLDRVDPQNRDRRWMADRANALAQLNAGQRTRQEWSSHARDAQQSQSQARQGKARADQGVSDANLEVHRAKRAMAGPPPQQRGGHSGQAAHRGQFAGGPRRH
ncbi:Hypothetical protein D9617_4g001350 [Elsinoe fawcettii]|nr:Hypothetical protein D9617_4g001350 [Elsinoe fawcettii]